MAVNAMKRKEIYVKSRQRKEGRMKGQSSFRLLLVEHPLIRGTLRSTRDDSDGGFNGVRGTVCTYDTRFALTLNPSTSHFRKEIRRVNLIRTRKLYDGHCYSICTSRSLIRYTTRIVCSIYCDTHSLYIS